MRCISVRLDEDHVEKFEHIKFYLGLKNDTEVVRLLISEFYKQYVAKSF